VVVHRRYAATYEQAMAEIDAAVGRPESQRRNPDRRHRSLARRQCRDRLCRAAPDLAGVVALAPGHLPEAERMRSFVATR
jgi:hypothetical protein